MGLHGSDTKLGHVRGPKGCRRGAEGGCRAQSARGHGSKESVGEPMLGCFLDA